MMMPRWSGIDLGNQIRLSGNESAIIYITSSDDYALNAYGVRAIRYLLKPVDENKLFEALDYALSYTKVKAEPVCLIKTKEGLIKHLSGGEVLQSLFIRKSFEEEIQEIANQNNFQQIHKSFLVNLDYVKQLTPDSVIMKSGIELPVSKGKAAKVKREYLLFISAQYR